MLAAAMQLSHQAGLLGAPGPPPPRTPLPGAGATAAATAEDSAREVALRAALAALYRETLSDVLVACRCGVGWGARCESGGHTSSLAAALR
jgi:hypothetical protein